MKRLFLPLSTILILVVLLFSSCASTEVADSKNVSQDQIHMYFESSYNANTKTASAKGQFRFGGNSGTTLKLSSPSIFTYNQQGVPGSKTLFSGYSYYTTYPNYDYKGENNFKFVDSDGKEYNNTLSLAENSISATPFTIGEDGIVKVDGTIEAGATSKIEVKNDSSRFTYTVQGHQATIPSQHLDSLQHGTIQFFKTRKSK